MMERYYLVIMQRYGNSKAHSYCVGVTKDPVLAEIAGLENKMYRGGKYEPYIKIVERHKREVQYLLIQHNDESKGLDEYGFYATLLNQEENEQLENRKRDYTEVKKVVAELEISDEEILNAHNYWSMFSEKALEYLRSRYEKIARRQLT